MSGPDDRSGELCGLRHCFLRGSDPSEIYTLSLHDALPISECAGGVPRPSGEKMLCAPARVTGYGPADRDRKSTRLNSSHRCISYAVFCLKKKTAPGPSRTALGMAGIS